MSNSAALLSAKVAIVEEEPRVRTIQAAPTAVTGCVGVTERGPFGANLVQSFAEYVKLYGGYTQTSDVALAADGFFANGGQQLWVVRTVHYADITNAASKTSAQGSATIQTSNLSPSAGFDTSIAGPWALTPGQQLDIIIDGGSTVHAVFNATQAALECATAGNYALSNNQNLTVSIDGGSVQTITFLTGDFPAIGAATPAQVAAVINTKLVGASASATSGGTKVTITSDKKGLGSNVHVTGGTANGALGFSTTGVAGTGNVQDINAVAFSEAQSVIQAAASGSTVTNVGGAARITSNTTGTSSSVQVVGTSTALAFGFDNAIHTGNNAGALNTLRVQGKTDGAFANSLVPTISAATNGLSSFFNLTIVKGGVTQESFLNVTMNDTDPRFVETVVNDPNTGSDLVVVTDLDANTQSPNDRPANGTYTIAGGNDGLASLADTDYIGSTTSSTGMRALDNVNTLRLLICPGRATAAVHNAMLTYGEIARNMTVFSILSSPAGLDAPGIVNYVNNVALLKESSEFGTIYWPRIKVTNPSKNVFGQTATSIVVDPVGHIAGLYGRNDNSSPGGVYEAPAGIEFGKIAGAIDTETDDVKDEAKRDLVFPELINPITVLPGTPVHIDGARCLKSTSNFPTVGERRGVIFIETSIQAGLLFAKHRKIKASLLARLSRAVNAFLLTQLRNGAFASDDPKTAFFVDFSKALNPASQGFVRTVNGRIGLATAKPAEFIILRFSQDQRALEDELAQAAAA